MEREELVEEMKRRWMKPGKRSKEEIIDLLEQEDRGQRKIVWVKQRKKGEDNDQMTGLRSDRRMKEEEGGGHTILQDSKVEEAEWEDMIPVEEDNQTRSETVEVDSPMTSAKGRPIIVPSPGRLRGKGRRGYWVAKREEKLKGRTKSNSKPSGADSQ